MPKDDLPGDDADLFRAAIGRVRELPAAPPAPQAPKPPASPRMAARDDDDARSEFQRMLDERGPLQGGDVLSYRRNEIAPRILRKLAKGEFAAQDELDLHHADAASAEAMLRAFLLDCRSAGAGCVRIVHGKGLRSRDGVPVLKSVVDRILRQRSDVLAFHSAPAAQGGSGAVLVLLRPR